MKTSDLIRKSMEYERAYGKVSEILLSIREERRIDQNYARSAREKPDESFNLVISEIEKVRERFRNASDDLWRGAEEKSCHQESDIRELLSAVLLRAANDYELAVSGAGNEKEKEQIESFAENDASGFSKIRFPDVLKTIREAQPEFARLAKENAAEIIAETEINRKSKKCDNRENKYRCPLCGGGLYTQRKRGMSFYVVCCTGCSLRQVVPYSKKQKAASGGKI